MRATGIVNKIDKNGRVHIPKNARIEARIELGDELEFQADGDKLILKKKVPTCIFCGSRYDLGSFKGKCICEYCESVLAGTAGAR